MSEQPTNPTRPNLDRRNLLKNAGLLGAGLALSETLSGIRPGTRPGILSEDLSGA